MTSLAQFRVQVAAKMGLDNTTGSADQTLMNAWANQGYQEILSSGRFNVVSATMALTSGSSDYTLPTDILAINEMDVTAAIDGILTRLERVTPQQILDFRIGTQNIGAPPVRYYALNGASLLMVFPTPQAADTITLYYVPRPATLSADNDEPSSIPSEWHKVVEMFMLWEAGEYVNDKNSRNGESYRVLYEGKVTKLQAAALHRGGRKLSPAVVGRKHRRMFGLPSQRDA